METRKMTKTQAQEFVKNTKYIVWSADEGIQLQEKFFEIGCRWLNSGKSISHTEHPFLMVDEFLNIRYRERHNFDYFAKDKNSFTEIYKILNIEIEQEQPKPKFDPRTLKPFDKVLVKNDGEIWIIDFFDRYNPGAKKYYCIGGFYKYCIPYNEETKYLHGNGNKEPEFYILD